MAVQHTTMTEEVKAKRREAYQYFEEGQSLENRRENLAYESYAKASQIWLAIDEKDYGEEKFPLILDAFNLATALFTLYGIQEEPENFKKAMESYDKAERLLEDNAQYLPENQIEVFESLKEKCSELKEDCEYLERSNLCIAISEEFDKARLYFDRYRKTAASEDLRVAKQSFVNAVDLLELNDHILTDNQIANFNREKKTCAYLAKEVESLTLINSIEREFETVILLFNTYMRTAKPEDLKRANQSVAKTNHLLMRHWDSLTENQKARCSYLTKEVKSLRLSNSIEREFNKTILFFDTYMETAKPEDLEIANQSFAKANYLLMSHWDSLTENQRTCLKYMKKECFSLDNDNFSLDDGNKIEVDVPVVYTDEVEVDVPDFSKGLSIKEFAQYCESNKNNTRCRRYDSFREKEVPDGIQSASNRVMNKGEIKSLIEATESLFNSLRQDISAGPDSQKQHKKGAEEQYRKRCLTI